MIGIFALAFDHLVYTYSITFFENKCAYYNASENCSSLFALTLSYDLLFKRVRNNFIRKVAIPIWRSVKEPHPSD